MSGHELYHQIEQMLERHVSEEVDESSRKRLALLVTGMIQGKSAAPAQIAQALETLGLSNASAESIERRIRRIENDPEITAALCFHPFARQRLRFGRPQELVVIIDPTTQDDRVVMATVSIEYRGRSLPLAWAVWPANTPLEGERFWARIEALLDVVADLLPKHIPIIWVADRAFGTPVFTDMLTARGWHYVVRVQGQTRCKDRQGRERTVADLIKSRNQRAKMHGIAFKKRGWRSVKIVVYWGKRHEAPLCLVSDLKAGWYLIRLYRRRYPIEATFRDYKSHGWQWERGQVTDLDHLKRLLVGMALATWIALFVGTQVAAEILAQPSTGRRRTIPWSAKRSLFWLGLQRLHALLLGTLFFVIRWTLSDWNAPNWQTQSYFHHSRAFVFAAR